MRMLLTLLGATAIAAAAPPQDLPPRERPAHAYALIADRPDDGAELVGRRAPPWSFERWARGPARSLDDLRGKVVLVRWWTDGCMYCAATLPALETLRKRYAADGLVIVGAYHPKPPRRVQDRAVVAFADRLGFDGPIALDERWQTLDRYWLRGRPRDFTSVSFLIDRDGIIRWVHAGGEYHPSDDPKHAQCDLEYRGLVAAIDRTLGSREARTP